LGRRKKGELRRLFKNETAGNQKERKVLVDLIELLVYLCLQLTLEMNLLSIKSGKHTTEISQIFVNAGGLGKRNNLQI